MNVSIVPALRVLKPAALICAVTLFGLAARLLGERGLPSGYQPGTTHRVQPQDPCRRERDPVHVLPHPGAPFHIRRGTQRLEMHGLS